MVLRKLTLLASLALVGYIGVSCSSQEDKESYDKFYGNGRTEREEAAASATPPPPPPAEEVKVDPAIVNALSVTENADTKVAASNEKVDDTPEPAGKTVAKVSQKVEEEPTQKPTPADIAGLLNKHACSACHLPYDRLVGPAYSDVAKKGYSTAKILELVYKPMPANWPGYPPMAAMTQVPKEDVLKLAGWINSL
jgi:cytochrome c551/c552